jgi:phage shock protein A
MSDEDLKTRKKELLDRIRTWSNRAEMAKLKGDLDLVTQALEHKRNYEDELAKLQEFDV